MYISICSLLPYSKLFLSGTCFCHFHHQLSVMKINLTEKFILVAHLTAHHRLTMPIYSRGQISSHRVIIKMLKSRFRIGKKMLNEYFKLGNVQ